MTTTYTTQTNPIDERLSASRKAIENKYVFPATIGGIFVITIVWAGSKYFASDTTSYWMNLLTEGVSIAITVLILDRLNEYRAEQRYKQNLIRQAGSVANNVAIDAIEQLRKECWLEGETGILKGTILVGANLETARMRIANLQSTILEAANLKSADLQSANLQYANLQSANLQNANLRNANLEAASLQRANLETANLQSANLKSANLRTTNLKFADMTDANLQSAQLLVSNLQCVKLTRSNLQHCVLVGTSLKDSDLQSANLYSANLWATNLESTDMQFADLEKTNLTSANLESANLHSANLRYAQLENAKFNEKTVLPDSEFQGIDENSYVIVDKYWTPDIDMTRYTDPEHPNFWEPSWTKNKGSSINSNNRASLK